MINYDSILSAFDGKPTLLQWLKMVKKALDESILKNVTIKQEGENIAFTFNFEDGTSVTTPYITIHNGVDGVSITGINSVSNEVVGDNTLTTLRAHYSNDTTNEFVVTAKNGKDGIGVLYYHLLKICDSNESKYITFTAYSAKENLTLEDALAFIPAVNKGNIIGISNNGDDAIAIISMNYGLTGNPIIIIYNNGTSYNFYAEKIYDIKLGVNL